MSDNLLTERFLEAFEYLKKIAAVGSAKEFADRISISASLISEAKKGRTNIRFSKIQKITEEYGVSREWLLTGNGNMFGSGDTTVIHGGHNIVADNAKDNQVGEHNVKYGLFGGKQRIQELEGENELLKKEVELLKKTIEQKDKMIDALLNK